MNRKGRKARLHSGKGWFRPRRPKTDHESRGGRKRGEKEPASCRRGGKSSENSEEKGGDHDAKTEALIREKEPNSLKKKNGAEKSRMSGGKSSIRREKEVPLGDEQKDSARFWDTMPPEKSKTPWGGK